jgi:hypothetical protein
MTQKQIAPTTTILRAPIKAEIVARTSFFLLGRQHSVDGQGARRPNWLGGGSKGGFSALVDGARMDGRVLTADVALRAGNLLASPLKPPAWTIDWFLLPGRAMDVLLPIDFSGERRRCRAGL